MALILGFTSMDQATETALRAAFAKANEQLDGRFSLAAENLADFVVIDMDSMYGPMGWLRLHAAGKQVIGLTAAARTQADFRLGRPFDTGAMVALLQDIAASAGEDLDAPALAADAEQASAPAADAAPSAEDAPAAPGEALLAADADAATDAARDDDARTGPDQPAAGTGGAGTPGAPEAAAVDAEPAAPSAAPAEDAPAAADPIPEPDQAPEPAPPPRDPVFADWMRPGALKGRVRYRRDDGPELWIDADARQYHGPAQLKPLAAYYRGPVQRDDFRAVADAEWAAGSAAAGEPQPLTRLQWLGGLLAGNGALLPGHDPGGRYRLTKWPQAEREYPRQFRIATAMMKGPATLAEIAEASGTPLADVADFTNANLATGFAELVPEPQPEPEPPAKASGFFGRLRGRS